MDLYRFILIQCFQSSMCTQFQFSQAIVLFVLNLIRHLKIFLSYTNVLMIEIARVLPKQKNDNTNQSHGNSNIRSCKDQCITTLDYIKTINLYHGPSHRRVMKRAGLGGESAGRGRWAATAGILRRYRDKIRQQLSVISFVPSPPHPSRSNLCVRPTRQTCR